MYIIEVPHQRPPTGHDHYASEHHWASTRASAVEWTAPNWEPSEALETLTDAQLIEWAKHDFQAVYVMLTLVEVLDRLMTCERDHQGARIESICARWIAQATP